MRCIAHRGFAETHPENTVRAVRDAIEAGADAIEVDVRRCRSGEVVVIHDETVDRVTDGTGPVAEHSRSELATLDVLGTDEGVPTLREVCAGLEDDVGLVVELKETGLASDALAAVADYGGDVLVSSFEVGALREARQAGTPALALLFASDPSGALDTARALDCRAVHPNRRLCDPEFVERCHAAGFGVTAWTVRTAEQARRVQTAGVDGIIADSRAPCVAVATGTDGNRETD